MRLPWQQREKGKARHAIYVHLATDGGIFLIRGATGEELWVDRDGMLDELDRLKGNQRRNLIR